MKKFSTLLLSIGAIIVFSSCEIVQETQFKPDGSGTYSLGFDMSEMMKMGMNSKKDSTNNKQIDTLIHFSKFIEEKRDSISKLSKEDQEKINQLKAFSLYMKSDTVSKQLRMKLEYKFKNVADLKKFSDKLKNQNVKELDFFTKKLGTKKDSASNHKQKKSGLEDFDKAFKTTFSRSGFSAKITEEALQKAIAKKDTTLTKENPMSNMIRFKIRYIFPYKIKKVSNKNVRILPDFKGVEINANLFETNKDPRYFDLEIEFDK